MEIVLNLNSAENSLDLIKYCTLYFDKLKIDAPINIDSVEILSDTPDSEGGYSSRINFTQYISDSVKIIRNMLIKEGICIDDEHSSLGQYNQLAKKIVAQNSHLFFLQKVLLCKKIVWKYVMMPKLFWMKQSKQFQK